MRKFRNGLRGSATSELNKVKFNFTNVEAEISVDLRVFWFWLLQLPISEAVVSIVKGSLN